MLKPQCSWNRDSEGEGSKFSYSSNRSTNLKGKKEIAHVHMSCFRSAFLRASGYQDTGSLEIQASCAFAGAFPGPHWDCSCDLRDSLSSSALRNASVLFATWWSRSDNTGSRNLFRISITFYFIKTKENLKGHVFVACCIGCVDRCSEVNAKWLLISSCCCHHCYSCSPDRLYLCYCWVEEGFSVHALSETNRQKGFAPGTRCQN